MPKRQTWTMTYSFSADPARMDRDRVFSWIAEQSYWAQGRARETQERAMDGSFNYGMFDDASGEQVAYARVVSDGATFAWLCDVFVDESVRGAGVGVALIEGVCGHLDPMGLRRIMLATRDAHGLYAKFGFGPVADPEMWMARTAP